jgi:hypothetical protein
LVSYLADFQTFSREYSVRIKLRTMQGNFFPGLVTGAFTSGSRYIANPPKLISLIHGDSGETDASWEARGSTGDTYSIRASGSILRTAKNGKFIYSGLDFSCDCPDAEKSMKLGTPPCVSMLSQHSTVSLTMQVLHLLLFKNGS